MLALSAPSEAKRLATQTSKAAEEVGELIGHIQSSTRETIGAIREITAMVTSVGRSALHTGSSAEQVLDSAKSLSCHTSER